MYICEFQNNRSGAFFGRTEHPSRETAEEYAVDTLIALGESESDSRAAARLATRLPADTRKVEGYGVRIFNPLR